jgi:hypothetical protein
VVQGVSPEFKPQYQKEREERQKEGRKRRKKQVSSMRGNRIQLICAPTKRGGMLTMCSQHTGKVSLN